MIRDYTICVGTVGQGIWQSPDEGNSWNRIRTPFPLESQLRALAVHPQDPQTIFAGSNNGIYRSDDKGSSWEKLDSPMDTLNIWSIAIDPSDPNTIFVGTSPPYLLRTRDGGQHWDKLSVQIAQECAIGTPRVTAILVDPVDRQTVWAGVEIDGVYRSLDGGDTWTRITDGVKDPDIHGMAISLGAQKRVLVSTPREIFTSTDVGESWHSVATTRQFPLAYCRWVAVKVDNPQVIFVANGDSAIGSTGAIVRSSDGGQTWESRPLPVEPNSPIWNFAVHPADPDLVLANSLFGELYRSNNGGDSWEKLKREFSEVRALAWLPN
jgi:photosystem II stability/assembly factor-like uncharacterized protein